MALAFPTHIAIADDNSALLVAELQGAHDALLRAMAELDELTRGPLPCKARIIEARWTIGRSSLARRKLWNRVFAHFSGRVSAGNAADLRQLTVSDMVLRRSSSEHISKWTVDTIVHDWPGYCLASNDIRWKMKAAIDAEKRLLYPMLESDGD